MASVLLSWLHFVLIFAIVSVLTIEMALCRAPLTMDVVRRLARVDMVYGLSAVGLLMAGFLRAMSYEKGWAFYQASPWFWIKVTTFAIVGGLSLVPTLTFVKWRKTLAGGGVIDGAVIAKVRRFIHLQLAILPVIVLSAALMARGF